MKIRHWLYKVLTASLMSISMAIGQLLVAPPAWAASAPDYPIENGHFYTEANGQGGGPGEWGYSITDDGGIPFWTAFQQFGGVAVLGYPISQRYQVGAFVYQATQKALLQWDGRNITIANVLDQLHNMGLDPLLQAKFLIPPPLDMRTDAGLSWGIIEARHLQLLASSPLLQAAYFSVSNPLLLYGIPTSAPTMEANGAVTVVRLQRAVLQLWNTAQPWAAANQVTVGNAGDILKGLNLLPAPALTLQAPPSPAAVSAITATSSNNWAGYFVTPNNDSLEVTEFTDVKGTWAVPQLDCTKSPNGDVGVWVGLDGVESPTVEQTGISSQCSQGGAQYSAWVEIYPGDPRTVAFPIAPGNQISAEVQYLGGQLFRLSLTNLTTGQSFTVQHYAPGANLSSAEWIVEAPLVNGSISGLAAFSPITISGTTVTADGQTGSIANPHWVTSQVEMDTPAGAPRARVSPLDANGSTFTVTWVQQ